MNRDANSIFRMSRYIEGVENAVRCLDAIRTLALDLPSDDNAVWGKLIASVGNSGDVAAHYRNPTSTGKLAYGFT
ncbi:MAG: alpha-E domain-containing protein [Acidobacteriota bacterium]